MIEGVQPIGFISSSKTPTIAEMIASSPVAIGTYVYVEFNVRDRARKENLLRRVIGIVTNTSYQPAVPTSILSLAREDLSNIESKASRFTYSPMTVYVVADIGDEGPTTPIYPIPPNTPVYSAHDIVPSPIEKIYKRSDPEKGLLRIGLLARFRNLEVAVDANRLYKHLLITGATGSGKSNAVAILIDRLSRLGAPVMVFDVHGEYTNMVPEDGNKRVDVIKALVNPLKIRRGILAKLIIPEPTATRQRRYLMKTIRELEKEIVRISSTKGIGIQRAIEELVRVHQEGKTKQKESTTQQGDIRLEDLAKDIFERDLSELTTINKFNLLLIGKLRVLFKDKDEKRVAQEVEDKYLEFVFSTPILSFDAVDPLDRISPGKILVYDVSELTDHQKTWVLKLLAEELLDSLKRRYKENLESGVPPTVLVVEEAPLFISRDSDSIAKEGLKRFAREGRKFGGVLVIVSQRPRVLDPDISSQIQNFLFLKLVQEDDIRSVMNIADNLEESIARTLPVLPTGWGILMGEWVGRFPALVAVDKHEGKIYGASPDLVSEWKRSRERFESGSQRPSSFLLEE